MDFSRLFGKNKPEPTALVTMEKLAETLEMLEKKENVMQKKIAAEVEKAREFNRTKNKKAAIQCLKRKKMFESQVENLSNFALRIQDQMIMLESAKATAETVVAMKEAAQAMKQIHRETKIESLDKAMDEIMDQADQMKQLQDALAQPIGEYDFDEDDLEAELNNLEEMDLEEQLLKPATGVPTTVPTRPPAVAASTSQAPPARRPEAQRSKEDEELEALQAEMAS